MPEISFQGGINETNDIKVSKEECISGFNFDLAVGKSSFTPRKPLDLKVTAPSRINAILQLVKRDDSFTTLLISDTAVYDWDGSDTLAASIATVTTGGIFRDVIWDLDERLIITDVSLQNPVKQWDSTTFTTMANGLGGPDLRAKYGIVHNSRLWLFNVQSGGTNTPHLMVASRLEDHTDYDLSLQSKGQNDDVAVFATVADPFFMVSPDLKEINGAAVFNQELIISTENGRLYRIIGDNPNNYNIVPYYQGSAAIGKQAFENIGNDLTYMRNGGVIESLIATDTSGDVTANDLSLPIRETARGLNDAKIVYDQQRQKVYYFVAGQALVLFKELIGSGLSPWTFYRTGLTNSFNQTAAKYLRIPGTNNFSVYFGDEQGRVFDINGTGLGDAGDTDIQVQQKKSMFDTVYGPPFIGRLIYRRRQEVQANIQMEFGDELTTTNITLKLKGDQPGVNRNYYSGGRYYSNGSYYSEGVILGSFPNSVGFSPIGRGLAAFLTIELETSRDFLIDKLVFADDDTIKPRQFV